MTISQALGKAVFKSGKFYWIRISRRKVSSLVEYWANQHDFYYMKVYEFKGSGLPKFSPGRTTGKQIGYIFKNPNTNQFEFRNS
jgi:hypothetical protein